MDTVAPSQGSHFVRACRRFDDENSQDPNTEIVDGIPRPRELVYAERLSEWLLRLAPEASEWLRLAARCQHICRWTIPRRSYPMDRPGYLRWRHELKHFHARKAGEILRETGYPEEIVARVQDLNLKKNFPSDPESRVLEDALCLVFLEFQLGDLAGRTTEEKLLGALRKTWNKMTAVGHAEAFKLPLPPRERALLERALDPAGNVSSSSP